MKLALKKLTLAIGGAGMLTIYGCSGGSGGGTPPSDDVASLPANLLAQPALSTCAAVRSGRYNQIMLVADSPNFPDKIAKFSIDAAAGTATGSNGTGPIIATGESCHSTFSSGTNFFASPAGVILMRFGYGATKYLGISLPEQAFTLADIAGTWNILGMGGTTGAYEGFAATATVNSTGSVTAMKQCANGNGATWDVTSCVDTTTNLPSFRANSDGGFDIMDSTNVVGGRMFAYKAGNGDVMAITVSTDGTFYLFTKQRTVDLPAVGEVTTSWNLWMNNLLISDKAVDAFNNTVVSVDSVAKSWVRSNKAVGETVAHPETLFGDTPRTGYVFRPAGTSTATDGTIATFNEFTKLKLRGMGVNVVLHPAQKRLVLAVDQP